MKFITRVKFRRATAALWTFNNPVLFEGEAGYEADTGKFKIGDGVTAWSSLPILVVQKVIKEILEQKVIKEFKERQVQIKFLMQQKQLLETVY